MTSYAPLRSGARARAVRRANAQRVIVSVIAHWGMGLVAHRLAFDIVGRLERAGYLKGL